ncbi:head maturation protease, ClpP-related [Clostridium sp. YIM B02551]|uniref:head maturation protease, ClpP-related n=1 Tax=Clostridium sp. YIM B02551 TaxID=2910679 RepID=UPI001EECA79E|nr:head maturation protease, ClpP-related [Clostridium sp. YIM B02551]
MAKFWRFVKNQGTEDENIELRIEGDIISDDDTWIYEWLGINATSPNIFKDELRKCKGKCITVWIDSYGGDVFAAAGIYNALKEHDGKITVKIDGKAMSAASVIAMAGDEILMSPVAIMMIHNPLSSVQGYASDMRKQADVLDTVKESILNAYCSKTKMDRKKVSEMMDKESYMDANTAVENCFADGILYQEGENINNVMNISFNRNSIQNSANEALKHLLEVDNINKLNKIKNMNSECNCNNCNHSDNCQSSGAKCCVCSECNNVSKCSKPGSNGCRCNICTMAENNCCQVGSDSCMCSTCGNEDCLKGKMKDSDSEMNNKKNMEILKAKLALECEL